MLNCSVQCTIPGYKVKLHYFKNIFSQCYSLFECRKGYDMNESVAKNDALLFDISIFLVSATSLIFNIFLF